MRMADIHGTCDERFEAVRGALAKNLDSGDELGASIVVDIDGDNVVDMWGGFRDEARTIPWDEHTITNVWSSTKTVTSLAALMLVDLEALGMDSPAVKTFTGPTPVADYANTPAWRRADIGAANGHGNARSVARVMSVVARGGEVDGVRLLGPETIDVIFREQLNGIDLVLGVPLRFGIGYGLPLADAVAYIPDEKICFWGGWGGSIILMDLGRRMTVSYMMNKMGPGVGRVLLVSGQRAGQDPLELLPRVADASYLGRQLGDLRARRMPERRHQQILARAEVVLQGADRDAAFGRHVGEASGVGAPVRDDPAGGLEHRDLPPPGPAAGPAAP